MRGVEEYISRHGIRVIRINYTADCDKDPSTEKGAAWLKEELRGYPGGILSSKWRQEMENDWEATGGDLVFPQLSMFHDKIVVGPFEVPDSWRLFGSFDYGIRNPSCFLVNAIDYDHNIWTVWEWYKAGMGYRDMAKIMRGCPYWSRLSYLPLCDPSLFNLTQQTELGIKTLGQLFMELPEDERVYFAGARKGGDVTVAAKVNGDLWTDLGTKEARWKIFATCPKLVWELGKLRWAEWSSSQAQVKGLREELVDKDNHAFDAQKYFFTAYFEGPLAAEVKPYDHLRRTDPASYAEWKYVEELHRQESGGDGTMGDFE